MRLLKFIQCMVMVTIVALIYIHMQMQIFDLAYQGKRKQKQITSISEVNDMVFYDILQLKSSRHLGGKLLSEDSSMQFFDQDSVVQLVTTTGVSGAPAEVTRQARAESPLLTFLSLGSSAQAFAQEKIQLPKFGSKQR